jgi:hypothetical protein
MGWRFQRRRTIAPRVRLNLGKRGASVSVGRRGAHATVGRRGPSLTLSLLGTGLSYVFRSRRR